MANLNIAIQIAARDQASGPIGRITNSLTGLKDRGLSGLQTAGNIAMTGLVAGAGLAVGAIGVIGTVAFGVSNDVQTATGEIQSALNTTTEEAANLAGVARDVWGNNFAGSISEAASAVGLVRQQLGDLNNGELQDAAENAFRIADAYGEEVPASVSAANTLMDEFGLTQQQAFDFIAKGFQSGMNASDDFLDTIGEYSNLFGDAGFGADQFFSILESGQAAGVLGVDKVADAVKEFGIIMNEENAAAGAALEALGLDYDDMVDQVATGSSNWSDYFDDIVGAINGVEDPMLRAQYQTALFGTMAEDLGVSFTEGLSSTMTSLDDMVGAVDAVDSRYNNLSSAAEGYKRRAMLALQPIGDVLLGLANNAMPLVDSAFAVFETNIVPAIETAAGVVQGFINNLSEGMSPLNSFIEAIWDIAPPEVLDFLVRLRDEILPGLSTWFTENVQPVIDMVTGFVSWQDVLTGLGIILASVIIPAAITLVGTILSIAAPIAIVIGAVALLRTAWENNWGGIQEKTGAVLGWIQNTISTVIGGVQAFWQEHGNTILLAAQLAWTGIQTAVNTAITTVQEIITTVVTGIQTFWDAHGQTIMTAAETTWNFIQSYIETALGVVKSVFAAFKSAFEGDWRGFGANLRQAWDQAWTFIKTTFTNAKSALLSTVSGFILDMIAKFGETDWTQLAWNVINGLIDGLGAGAAAVVAKMQEIGQAAWDAWNGFWDSNSPSERAKEGAGYVTSGIVTQWERDQDVLANAATALGRSAHGGLFGRDGLGSVGSRLGSSSTINHNYYLQADYRMQDERSLRDDIRLLQLLTPG